MLVAEIIGFGFHVRQSLYQAAELDRPINQVMRLRSGAASLGLEAYRNLVKLEALPRGREPAREQAQADIMQTPPITAPLVSVVQEPVAEGPVAAPAPVAAALAAAMAAAVETASSAASTAPRYADLSKEAIRRLTPAEQKRIYLERMTQNNRRRQAEQAKLG